MPRPTNAFARLAPALGLIALVLIVVACAAPGASLAPGATPTPVPIPTPHPPLAPATPGTGLDSFIGWIFTPIFQTLFIILAGVYALLYQQLGINTAILWAIIVMTLLVRFVLVPLYRRQLVSTRRTQLLQPEVREIQKRYKGDRAKIAAAQQAMYKERGVNPLAGCLPALLQLPLLLVVYQVIQSGLTNPDPSAMLTVFGVQVVHLDCVNPSDPYAACMQTTLPLLGDVSKPSSLFHILGFGVSLLAIISAGLQLVQSRMILPASDPASDDPNARVQRQTMLLLPLFSIVYGGFLPAGLFIYWIVATIFSIIQQYLIVGWGGMFPFFGWTPGFARDHTPRYPVTIPPPAEKSTPTGGKAASTTTLADRATSADGTIRPRRRGRRGRRR